MKNFINVLVGVIVLACVVGASFRGCSAPANPAPKVNGAFSSVK